MPTTCPDSDLSEPPSEQRMLYPRPNDSELTAEAIANLSNGLLEAQRDMPGTERQSALHEDVPKADSSTTATDFADLAAISQNLDTRAAAEPLTMEALQRFPEDERSSRTAEWLEDEDIPEE